MERRLVARFVLLITALAIVAVGVLPVLVGEILSVGEVVPEPLATQWSFDGEVSSTMSWVTFLVLVSVFVVPSALVLLVAAGSRKDARPGSRLWVAVVALVGSMMAVTSAMTIIANDGHSHARDVPGPAIWQLALVIAVPLLVSAAVAWAVAQLPEIAYQPAPSEPLTVADEAVVSWSQNLTVSWLLWLTVVMGSVGLGLALLTADAWIGVILIVSVLPAALLARIEVFADRRGLTVTYGPWGWPRTHIPLDRIESVEAIDLKPAEWGGWGYRGSLKLLRQAAVVLRAGPGLRVDLVDGRRFAVTIDDPGTAAAVLARELQRG